MNGGTVDVDVEAERRRRTTAGLLLALPAALAVCLAAVVWEGRPRPVDPARPVRLPTGQLVSCAFAGELHEMMVVALEEGRMPVETGVAQLRRYEAGLAAGGCAPPVMPEKAWRGVDDAPPNE